MSAGSVQCEVLGQTVEGTEIGRIPSGDFGTGPKDLVVVEVGESTYRVEEEDVQ